MIEWGKCKNIFDYVTFGLGGVCTVDCPHLFTIGSTLIKHTPFDWKYNFLKGNLKTNFKKCILILKIYPKGMDTFLSSIVMLY